jgi:hypothetical protein
MISIKTDRGYTGNDSSDPDKRALDVSYKNCRTGYHYIRIDNQHITKHFFFWILYTGRNGENPGISEKVVTEFSVYP